MNISNILVAVSSVLTIVAILPYFIEVIRGKTKPRVVTWVIWSLLTFIGFLAAITEKQYPTAILLALSSLATFSIVIFGWKLGDKKIERVDVICFIGAIIGIILWQVFHSASFAMIVMIIVDLIGGIPTLIHSWKKPEEETWMTFLLSFFAAFLTLLAVEDWQITGFAFPLYLVIMNLLFTLVIVVRAKKMAKIVNK